MLHHTFYFLSYVYMCGALLWRGVRGLVLRAQILKRCQIVHRNEYQALYNNILKKYTLARMPNQTARLRTRTLSSK